MSDITIVIPVHNRAGIVGRTLESVRSQSVMPARVVLVDNDSDDNSLQVIESWASAMRSRGWDVMVDREPCPGACAARNLGLGHVQSDWVMFFDSDDVMSPNHLRDFQQTIDSNPEAQIIGRDINILLQSGKKKRGYFKSHNSLFNHVFRGCLSTQRFIARTDLVRQAGAWDPGAQVWNDWELGIRLLLSEPNIAKVTGTPSVTTYFQEDSITGRRLSDKAGQWETTLDIARKDIEAHGRHDLLPLIDVRAAILASAYHQEGRKDLARRLMMKTLSGCSKKRRIKLLYLYSLTFHHFTWAMSKLLGV